MQSSWYSCPQRKILILFPFSNKSKQIEHDESSVSECTRTGSAVTQSCTIFVSLKRATAKNSEMSDAFTGCRRRAIRGGISPSSVWIWIDTSGGLSDIPSRQFFLMSHSELILFAHFYRAEASIAWNNFSKFSISVDNCFRILTDCVGGVACKVSRAFKKISTWQRVAFGRFLWQKNSAPCQIQV